MRVMIFFEQINTEPFSCSTLPVDLPIGIDHVTRQGPPSGGWSRRVTQRTRKKKKIFAISGAEGLQHEGLIDTSVSARLQATVKPHMRQGRSMLFE